MIRLERVTKVYRRNGREVRALDDVSLDVGEGEFVIVHGPSGSGKTTLLFTIAALLLPDRGRVLVAERDLGRLGAGARAAFRASHVGLVFQTFHLLPYLTVVDNVLLAPSAGGGDRRDRALDLLEKLGLGERAEHVPAELSAGECQRAGIARALLNRPRVLLADEPTGNLDAASAADVFRHLDAHREAGGTLVVVTHGTTGRDSADRIVELRDGKLTA